MEEWHEFEASEPTQGSHCVHCDYPYSAHRPKVEADVIDAAVRLHEAERVAWIESEVGNSPEEAKSEKRKAGLALWAATDTLVNARKAAEREGHG